jgi:asparagine synthase (glutamine-hydrolysing)
LESTRYMRNQLLRDSDWASMAHSIELRVPLVDVELTRFVSQQRRQGQALSKRDLAAATRPSLPQALTQRPKTGFTVPVRDWMQPTGKEQAPQAERGLRDWQQTAFNACTGALA